MIILFHAFAREIAPLKRRMKARTPIIYAGVRGFRAPLGAKDFAVVDHGIGMRRTRESVRRAFDSIPGAELVIGTGVAGALSAGLKPGDIVIADRIVAVHAEGRNAEHVAALSGGHIDDLRRALTAAGIGYATGAILTSHCVLHTGAEKRRAKEATGAIAVDMETAAIAVEASARGIPFAVIRAVLDEVDDEVAGIGKMDEQGRIDPLATAAYLVRNPRTALQIPRMMRNLSIAAKSIASAIEAVARGGKMR